MSARARLFGLARVLLRRGPFASSSLPLLLMVTSISACIVPLAPEFQDPPAAQNYPPTVVSADPPLGSIVTQKSMFSLVLRDPNVNDDLFVRWEADFPPFNPNLTRGLNGSGTTIPHPTGGLQVVDTSVIVDCQANALATSIPQHQIMAIVADRPFLPGGDLDSSDGNVLKASWTLNLECMPPAP
jgi:hypothetical protein